MIGQWTTSWGLTVLLVGGMNDIAVVVASFSFKSNSYFEVAVVCIAVGTGDGSCKLTLGMKLRHYNGKHASLPNIRSSM